MMKRLALLLLLFLAGCTIPLYESRDRVGIDLWGSPTVTEDSYEFQMKFDSPTDDPYLIQWIDVGPYHGVEAFRVVEPYKSQVDTHSVSETNFQHRRITIAPGDIEGADETFWGFSMLPSQWPDNFNATYRANHNIQGRVVYRKPEHETVYYLHFENGVLTWWIEGHEDEKREWRAEGK
jgi:hypothetical protein